MNCIDNRTSALSAISFIFGQSFSVNLFWTMISLMPSLIMMLIGSSIVIVDRLVTILNTHPWKPRINRSCEKLINERYFVFLRSSCRSSSSAILAVQMKDYLWMLRLQTVRTCLLFDRHFNPSPNRRGNTRRIHRPLLARRSCSEAGLSM